MTRDAQIFFLILSLHFFFLSKFFCPIVYIHGRKSLHAFFYVFKINENLELCWMSIFKSWIEKKKLKSFISFIVYWNRLLLLFFISYIQKIR